MPLFTYTARRADGTSTQGQIDAVSTQAARDVLKEINLEVEELHEATLSEKQTAKPPLAKRMPPFFSKTYFPLVETLRIYAGWLLALLSVAYILGAYQYTKELPIDLPFVGGLIFSPLLLQVALLSFLILLLSSVHRALKGSMLMGSVLVFVGAVTFFLYRINVV